MSSSVDTLIRAYIQGSCLAPISISWPCFQSIRVKLTRECFKSSYHTDLCGNESKWQPLALSTFMNLANYNRLTDGASTLDMPLMYLQPFGNPFCRKLASFSARDPDVKPNAWEPGLVVWNVGSRRRGLCSNGRLGPFQDEPGPIGENPEGPGELFPFIFLIKHGITSE